jgi:hypothetical protein
MQAYLSRNSLILIPLIIQISFHRLTPLSACPNWHIGEQAVLGKPKLSPLGATRYFSSFSYSGTFNTYLTPSPSRYLNADVKCLWRV